MDVARCSVLARVSTLEVPRNGHFTNAKEQPMTDEPHEPVDADDGMREMLDKIIAAGEGNPNTCDPEVAAALRSRRGVELRYPHLIEDDDGNPVAVEIETYDNPRFIGGDDDAAA
jgi:hypothetical protein